MPVTHFFRLFLVMLFVAPSTSYASVIEPDYRATEPSALTPVYGNVGAAERKADLDFIAGMRPHHAGALTMSQDYLSSPKASDSRLRQLARGIIHNQQFEVGMLDMVEGFMKPQAPHHGTEWRQVANKGLAQKQRFVRAPIPALWGGKPVSEEDVRFAKAMIVHHEGALIMCRDYMSDPAATNKYLRLMCVDILRDQKLDIAFMNSVIGDYAGNPENVKIDPSMVHGMEGMAHGHGSHLPSKSHGTGHHNHH